MKKIWYKFKHKIFPFMLAYLAKGLLSVLLKTCRFEIKGLQNLKLAAQNDKCIVMLWHNRVALAAEILSSRAPDLLYAALISQSRDGEIIASIIESYSIATTIRVPHNARKEALINTVNHLTNKPHILVITPDGPRGPRYRIKRGIGYIAKATGANIVSLSWSANKYWKMKTWDGLMIPKPFSSIAVVFAPPVTLEKGNCLPTGTEITALEDGLMQTTEQSLEMLK